MMQKEREGGERTATEKTSVVENHRHNSSRLSATIASAILPKLDSRLHSEVSGKENRHVINTRVNIYRHLQVFKVTDS